MVKHRLLNSNVIVKIPIRLINTLYHTKGYIIIIIVKTVIILLNNTSRAVNAQVVQFNYAQKCV